MSKLNTESERVLCQDEKTIKSLRQTNIDILRIVASFMVIMVHVSASKWQNTDVTSSEWAAMNLYDSAVRSCVPLFFMISGRLFLGKHEMVSLPKLLRNNVLKLVIIYLVWSFVYAIDTVGIEALFSASKILNEIVPLIIKGRYFLWFLPTMIGVYLVMPILFSFKEYKNGKYIRYALIIFLIFTISFTTIKQFFPQSELLLEILSKIKYVDIGFCGYFLLGYYLSKKDYSKVSKSTLLILLMLIIGISTVIGRTYSINAGEPIGILYGYMTLPVFLEAILIFVFFLKIKPKVSTKMAKVIAHISKGTLGIYLIHPFIIEYLQIWFGINTVSFNPWFSIPIISMGVFALSIIMILLLSKVPVANKWLI